MSVQTEDAGADIYVYYLSTGAGLRLTREGVNQVPVWTSDGKRIDFVGINRAALANVDRILRRWLPGGRYEGAEYVVKNPKRADHKAGSFKVNTNSGKWADFATGDRGGDLVSLAAFLGELSQVEAARELADMLGVPFNE